MNDDEKKEVHYHYNFWPTGDLGCAFAIAVVLMAMAFFEYMRRH